MPELPEVETVVRELRQKILHKKINSFQILWHRTLQDLSEIEITNQKINRIGRQGKYIIVYLSHTCLIIHLRMTGQLIFTDYINSNDTSAHTRFVLEFSDKSGLQFKDTRKFGRIYHVKEPFEVLSHIGLDALDESATLDYFKALLKSSRMNIKAFLLSQKYISGMGNIYTDEALFLSGIHPSKQASAISGVKSRKLYQNMHQILENSIRNMGSTISDYRDINGNSGKNQNYFYVYQRENLPCKICGKDIKKIKFAGRGTHFCPKCQKP